MWSMLSIINLHYHQYEINCLTYYNRIIEKLIFLSITSKLSIIEMKLISHFLINSDPRSPPSPRMNAFGPPNQSRSFKILQQVTNTFGNESDENEAEQQRVDHEPMREQLPLYSRPLGPDEMNESQMRRMQLSDNDRAFMNRVKTQGEYQT